MVKIILLNAALVGVLVNPGLGFCMDQTHNNIKIKTSSNQSKATSIFPTLNNYFPQTPRSFRVFSLNKKFVFIMLSPEKYKESEMSLLKSIPSKGVSKEWRKNMILKASEILYIRNKYKNSGLYLNDGSNSPLWIVDWFSQGVRISNDGIHLIKVNLHPFNKLDEGVTFYRNGSPFKSYLIEDLIDLMKYNQSNSNIDWVRNFIIDDEKKIFKIETNDERKYTFNFLEGIRVESNYIRKP